MPSGRLSGTPPAPPRYGVVGVVVGCVCKLLPLPALGVPGLDSLTLTQPWPPLAFFLGYVARSRSLPAGGIDCPPRSTCARGGQGCRPGTPPHGSDSRGADARRVGKAAPHVLYFGFFCLYGRQSAMKKTITITITITVDTNEPRRSGESCCMDGMSAKELRRTSICCSRLHLGNCPRVTKPSRAESWSGSNSESICRG